MNNQNEKSEIIDNESEKTPKNKRTLSKKNIHRITSAAVICIVVVGIIIINVIAVTLTNRYSVLTADITDSQSFNLTKNSLEIIDKIDKSVKITFLASKSSYEAVDPYCKQASALVNKMAQNSNGMISVEYIDIIQNPSYENNYPNDKLSTTDVIVTCGDKYKIVTADNMFNFQTYADNYSYIASSQAEQEIDTAILTVTSDVTTKVALITDNCIDDYSYLKTTLASNNYEITEISLVSQDIPKDTDMVIVYAPTKDFTAEAVKKLELFLDNNEKYGKNLLYISYRKQTDTPNIDIMLSDFGMKIQDGLAFDMDASRIAGNSYYDGIMCSFATDLYCDNIGKTDYPVIVSLSRSIEIKDKNIAESLLSLSSSSGYCPFDADSETWQMDKAVTGDVSVMAQGVIGNDKAQSTLIVSGSTYMFEKSMLGSSFSNSTYILDMFATLNNRDTSKLKLENKVITDYDLNISTQTAIITGVVMYAVIPLIILGVGLIIFFVRRNK